MTIKILFDHGLGDCANFAHVLALYTRRGYEFTVAAPADKHFVFRQCGVETTDDAADAAWVPWYENWATCEEGMHRFWEYNKLAINVSVFPLPNIGSPQDLWRELCETRIDLSPFVPAEDRALVDRYIERLPRPIVLIHSTGNSNQQAKSIPDNICRDVYRRMLDAFDGTLVLLDWDDRVPRLSNWRVRHLQDDWRLLSTPQLYRLIERSDLLVGIDSGPLHLARCTNTPTVGYFANGWGNTARFCLPSRRQANIIQRPDDPMRDRWTRVPYNFIECDEEAALGDVIATTCLRMLEGPRYLDEANLGADIQLQQFIRDRQHGAARHLTDYVDRHRSVDLLVREMVRWFDRPAVVATGGVRLHSEGNGKGISTYLFALLARRLGWRVTCMDDDPANCDFAAALTRPIADMSIRCADPITLLTDFEEPIDLLYLDGCDAGLPRAPEQALAEIQAGLHALHDGSIVVFDDTVYGKGGFSGRGALAVPWLLDQGWRIFYSGYQTICVREFPSRSVAAPLAGGK